MQTPQLFQRPSGPQSRQQQWDARLVRARDEVSKWNIVTTGANVWQVETRPGHVYTVRWDGESWSCTCPDYCNAFLGDCKHTLGVQLIQSQADQSQSVQSDQSQSQLDQSVQSQSQLDQSVQSQSVNQTEVSEMEDEKILEQKILEQLSFPFPAKALQWRVGPCNRDKTRGVALAYVDSRDYIERLNAVLGLGWEDAYTFTVMGTRIVCKCELRLHLKEGQSIVRTGDGDCELSDPNATTVASAQAFKRACVKFGLGAYLYGLPLEWVALEGDKNIPSEVQISLGAAYKRWLETGEWIFARGQRAPSTKPVAASAPSTAPVAASAPSTAPVAASAPSTAPVAASAPSTAPVAAPAPSTVPVAASAPSTKPVAASAPSPAPSTKSVPAPVAAANALGPGTFLVTRGEYRGQCIAQIYAQNPEYVQWLAEKSDFQPLRTAARTFLAMQTG